MKTNSPITSPNISDKILFVLVDYIEKLSTTDPHKKGTTPSLFMALISIPTYPTQSIYKY